MKCNDPFLCGKKILEFSGFKLDIRKRILETEHGQSIKLLIHEEIILVLWLRIETKWTLISVDVSL